MSDALAVLSLLLSLVAIVLVGGIFFVAYFEDKL